MNWLSFVSKEEIKLAQDPDWEYEDENPIHGFFPPNESDEPRESINEEKITPPEIAEKKEGNSTFNLTSNLTRNNDNPKQHSYNLRPRKKQRNTQQK